MTRFLRTAWPIASIALCALFSLTSTQVAQASEPCNPPNVIAQPVCDFDTFSGSPPREVPDGWTAFVLSGEPTFMRDEHSYFGGGTLRIWSVGGTFKAGIYTQVAVTPGAGYRASIGWGAPNAPDLFGRQLGIDPTGGVDATAPSVIWGPTHWGDGRMLNYPPGQGPNIDVTARALGNTVTVFFLTDHPSSSGDNLIFVDAIALYPDESAPAAEPPTATPVPPTATPEPVVAAAALPAAEAPTPEPTATFTPEPTATSEPSATPTTPPTPTPSPTPSPTVTPTWTPWPTATVEPAAFSVTDVRRSLATLSAGNSGRQLGILGAASFSGSLLFGGSLWWLRRRQRR